MGETPPATPHGDPARTTPVAGPPSAWPQPPTPAGPTQPSAWHQPPAGPGFSGAPRPPRLGNRTLVVGGGIAVVVIALIVTVVLVASGGSGNVSTGSLGEAAAPSATQSAGPVFTHVPASCSLVSQSTISTYAAGASCQAAPTDAHDLPGLITRQPGWSTGPGSADFVSIHVHLVVGSEAGSMYPMMKQSTIDVMGNFDTISDQHPVTGLGSAGVIAYGQGKNGLNSGDSQIVVLDGNAELDISYSGTVDNAGGSGTAVSQDDAENAVTAVAKDILGHLS